ncbi:hypothetical protein RSAG8_13641, partial [Rhizoctonia solani AG-8 WAC10335]
MLHKYEPAPALSLQLTRLSLSFATSVANDLHNIAGLPDTTRHTKIMACKPGLLATA